jgi:hypothetical protein
MNEGKKYSLVKPTLDTPFHIDFDWWKTHDQNWRVYLFSCLCLPHQQQYSDQRNIPMIDKVDPETGEVSAVDGLEYTLYQHCARQEDFLNDHTTLINSVVRIFLANGNTPLSVTQLSSITGKPAETILKTLTGLEVYKGIRPLQLK